MNTNQKETALPTKKTLSYKPKTKANIEKARAHLLGVCLLDENYIQYLPACVQLSCYGKFTLAMIKQGAGLEAIVSHLETHALDNAHEILTSAIKSVPHNMGLSDVFYQALMVVCSHG